MTPAANGATLLLSLALCLSAGCNEPYRVGELVWVQVDEGLYPAFIKEKGGRTKLVVHFEGCDSSWIREVSLDRIKGRVPDLSVEQMRPRQFVCTAKEPTPEQRAAKSPYKVGDRVRVRWRGSIYPATIVGIVASDRYLVHYEGHEGAWDETIGLDRISSAK